MRWASLAATLLLGTLAPNALASGPAVQRKWIDPRDLHHCRLNAVHPIDNDIQFEDGHRVKARRADVPAAVERAILDHVTKVAKDQFTVQEWNEAQQKCADIFPSVFKLIGPGGLQLYVVPRDFVLGNTVDYFFMYNPRSGAITKTPPFIFTKWSGSGDSLIKRPIVRFETGSKGILPRMIVQERTHNGTVYNAVVYRYFEVGGDMSLRQILAVEARAYLLSDGLTERKAVFITPNRIRIDVITHPPRRFESRSKRLFLERSGNGQPFHVARRAHQRKAEGLLTYCPSAKSDDDFLRVGCDFYY